jgi:hypothetical protein
MAVVTDKIIEIPAIDEREATVRIEGRTPYIPHAWSMKARNMIEAKQQGRASTKKPPKDPEAEREGTLYIVPGMDDQPADTPGRYFIPAAALKAAFVAGCRGTGRDLPMTVARGLMFLPEDPILEWNEMIARDDMVRNETGVVDTRYRWEFRGWGCDVRIQYDASQVTIEQLVNLVNRGGFSTGIGEWRPGAKKSLNGEYGRFHVAGVEA